MKIKKIIIIIVCCHFVIVFIFTFKLLIDHILYDSKLGEIALQIDENPHFLYYNNHQFYYKGKSYYIDNVLANNDYNYVIKYINNDYFIYSHSGNNGYDYYVIDEYGNNRFLFRTQDNYTISGFIDDIIYFEKNDYYYLYDVNNSIEIEITIDKFFMKAYDSKYTVLYNNGYIITDTSCDVSKKINIHNLFDIELIAELYNTSKKTLLGPRLEIKSIEIEKQNIYINISADNVNCITVKYYFDLDTCEIVGRSTWRWLEHAKSFHLNGNVCKPIEYLLSSMA